MLSLRFYFFQVKFTHITSDLVQKRTLETRPSKHTRISIIPHGSFERREKLKKRSRPTERTREIPSLASLIRAAPRIKK